MMKNDCTTGSLLARRELAEKATPEKWNLLQIFAEDENYVGPETWADMGKAVCICRYAKDAQYIAANSPDVAMADIDEILRLREEVEFWRQETQDVRENFERTLQCERDKTDRLEKEADWLAENCWKKPEVEYHPLREMRGGFYCDACPYDYDCRKCWREAARKAVEANHD